MTEEYAQSFGVLFDAQVQLPPVFSVPSANKLRLMWKEHIHPGRNRSRFGANGHLAVQVHDDRALLGAEVECPTMYSL